MNEELQDVKYYELMNYKESKAVIKSNINQIAGNFVAIGYYLKHIRDKEMFKKDGYQSVWELAQTEFGISKSQASKFMSINDRFSKDGNSPVLMDTYKDFSSSKLSEMLYLTDEQLEQVTVGTTVAEIREIKNPEKAVSTSKQKPEKVSPAQVEPELKKQYYDCAAYQQHQYSTRCKDCFYDKADCPYDRTEYFAKIKRQEEWLMHCEVLKEMCDCICKMSSYILEKNNYDMDIIKSLSRRDQSFSFGFGDDGTGHSKYDAVCKNEKYHVDEFNGTGKWIFEAGEVDQYIWNFNGRDWHNKKSTSPALKCNILDQIIASGEKGLMCSGFELVQCNDCDKYDPPVAPKLELIDDLDFTVRTYNCLKRAGIDTIEQLCELTEEDVIKIRNISRKCLDEIKEKLSEIGKKLKSDIPETVNDFSGNVDNEPEIANDVDKSVIGASESVVEEPESVGEEVETVQAEIIQTVPEYDFNKVSYYDMTDIKLAIINHQQNIASYIDCKLDAPIVKHEKMEMDALQCLEESLYMHDMPKPEKNSEPVQPELPILKNNDQRKDFIEAYHSWPLWVDTKETGEMYYRYDLSDKVAMVVKVSLRHGWREDNAEYGNEHYYLLGINYEYGLKGSTFTEDAARTFADCETNKSALVDYLKAFQKKGA